MTVRRHETIAKLYDRAYVGAVYQKEHALLKRKMRLFFKLRAANVKHLYTDTPKNE